MGFLLGLKPQASALGLSASESAPEQFCPLEFDKFGIIHGRRPLGSLKPFTGVTSSFNTSVSPSTTDCPSIRPCWMLVPRTRAAPMGHDWLYWVFAKKKRVLHQSSSNDTIHHSYIHIQNCKLTLIVVHLIPALCRRCFEILGISGCIQHTYLSDLKLDGYHWGDSGDRIKVNF